jgi:mono/diheme cytochrome c family protein
MNGSLLKKRSPFNTLLIAAATMVLSTVCWAQDSGEQLFNANCSACHTIGKGKLVGPDLTGVHDKRSQQWLESFVTSAKSMIDSGDAEAVAIFEEYNQILMPDPPIAGEQVRQILGYLKNQGAGAPAAAGGDALAQTDQVELASPEASPEDIKKGQALFQGTTRFANGGPTCNACHHVKNDAVIGGGILAAELTTVFSKMGSSGVQAILGRAPFPVMEAAYKNNALTDDEITYLVAFLQDADEQHLFQQPRDYGIGLFASGAVGAGVLFLLFGFTWRNRKSGSVNQAIYDRQVKSISDTTNR